MNAGRWITPPVESLLDVGCNVGEWLADCARRFPSARLAGVDLSEAALGMARERLPRLELCVAGAEQLPFPDQSFQYVTCMEVLEHLPAVHRAMTLREIRRVLRPGGRLILTVPHAGWFAWLDSNNIRFRLPRLYRRVVGQGRRDPTYAAVSRDVEWHHHFTVAELKMVVGPGWKRIGIQRGGLIVYPLMDWFSWPFYRAGVSEHPIRRLFERIAGWDYSVNYGAASYGILLALDRDR